MSTQPRLSGTRNGCRIYSTVDGRWRGFAFCDQCDREVAQHARSMSELHRRVDAHQCATRISTRREDSMASTRRRPRKTPEKSNDYPAFAIRAEPSPEFAIKNEKPEPGKYLDATLHAKRNPGVWFMITRGFTVGFRATAQARKFARGAIIRAPGEALFEAQCDHDNPGQFCIYCCYLDERGN